MAGAGAKKRLETNTRRLRLMRFVALTAFAAFSLSLLIRTFVIKSSTSMTASFLWLAVSSAVSYFAYSSLSSYAAPSYDSKGELIDGGGDLDKQGGTASHLTDLLYTTIFAQFGAAISLKFFYAYSLIPAYGLYLLTVNFIIPYLKGDRSQPTEHEMDPMTKKKLERTEKRQQKRATKWQ